MNTEQKTWGLLTIGICIIATTIAALFLAQWIATSPDAQALVSQFSYVGVVVVAIIGGLNIFVPIPAVTLTPIFTSAGLYLPFIILSLTIGTIIADYIGYYFGAVSRPLLYAQYPKIITWLENTITTRPRLLVPLTFLYAALLPIPNEVLVIPLAVLGIKFRRIFIPLFFGNLVNQSIYAIGFQTVFTWLF